MAGQTGAGSAVAAVGGGGRSDGSTVAAKAGATPPLGVPANAHVGTPPAQPIELGLFAPYNESVELVGSWNGFKPLPMERQPDGWWRRPVDLPDGEHRYKFRVKSRSYFWPGKVVDVFDPYAIAVSHDEHEHTVIKVEGGRQNEYSYTWKHNAVPLPPNDELVMYEMHVGDFTRGLGGRNADGTWAKGKFKDVLEKLDYLVDLGVNCVELMPVKEFPGETWGYTLKSLFAIENSYGPAADLARLIDELHGRGIRVVMDGVYNHAHQDSPLAHIDYDLWFYNPSPDPPEMQWGPKYDYTKWDDTLKVFPAKKYAIDSIRRMVEWFHIDGVRFDATKAIADFAILRELGEAGLKKVAGLKHFITVCEHIPEDPAVTGYPHAGPMHAAWHEALAKHLQATASRADAEWVKAGDIDGLLREMDPKQNGYESGSRTVNYASSHDQNRLMWTIGAKGKMFDAAAFRRMKLAHGLLLTIPGMPMLWMGQEFAMVNDKHHAEPRPLDWSLLNNATNADLLRYTADLVKLRLATPALRGDGMQYVMVDRGREVFAYKRWDDAGGVAVVMANLRDEPAGVTVENCSLEDGVWREHVFGYDATVAGGRLTDTLGPSEVKVFVKQ
jgi:1,4-alpha-glucan branching enzyme